MNLLPLAGIRRISLKIAWIHLWVAFAVSNAVADSAFITTPLQRTGADPNASGLITIRLGETNSSLLLQATNLTPGRLYTVGSAGVVRGRFVADSGGRGQLRLTQPVTRGALALNFDPRGQHFIIFQNRAVLQARVSGPGEPRGSVVNESVMLPRASGLARGSAEANYQLLANGVRRFAVMLGGATDGQWALYVDGVRRGTIRVIGGSGAVTFDNLPATPQPPLTFDPRGKVIDLARGADLTFGGKLEARANGINAARPSLQTYFIPSTGVVPAGLALARRWIDASNRRGLTVTLVDVPVGLYDLHVNDHLLGSISVLGIAGELRFSTDPDDDELLLNFNALAHPYRIERDGIVLFQGRPEPASLEDTNAVVPARLELPLLNLGRDADGIARVKWQRDEFGRRHFEVLLENVRPGDYILTVDGIPNSLVWVEEVLNGTRGRVEFDDAPALDELPLTFDPLGKTIGIERHREPYFERVLPLTP